MYKQKLTHQRKVKNKNQNNPKIFNNKRRKKAITIKHINDTRVVECMDGDGASLQWAVVVPGPKESRCVGRKWASEAGPQTHEGL